MTVKEDVLWFMAVYYIPTAVLFAVFLMTRTKRNKQHAAITTLLAWLLISFLLACYGVFRCVADAGYGGTAIGYAVGLMSTTGLSGPFLIVATRKNWHPMWCAVPCVCLPVVSFVGAEMLMIACGQTRSM